MGSIEVQARHLNVQLEENAKSVDARREAIIVEHRTLTLLLANREVDHNQSLKDLKL